MIWAQTTGVAGGAHGWSHDLLGSSLRDLVVLPCLPSAEALG